MSYSNKDAWFSKKVYNRFTCSRHIWVGIMMDSNEIFRLQDNYRQKQLYQREKQSEWAEGIKLC